MNKLERLINRLNIKQKISIFVVLFILILLSFGIPSLARIKNRLQIDNTETWDGITASSYRSGTGLEDDPYIISNAKELAYFSTMLEDNTYNNTYFKLTNNIIINNGTINFVDGNITYSLNNSTFYIKEGTNEFYDNVECNGIKIGTINIFNSLDNFEGYFDGNGYTIYGLFIKNTNEAGLFTDLNGNVHDLYVKNTYIEGENVGGIASTSTNATIKNVMFEGILKASNIAGGIIGVSDGTSLENTINRSNVLSTSIAGGLIGTANGITNILQSYNTGSINSNISAGLIGTIKDNTQNVNIVKSYNKGEIVGEKSASLVGIIQNNIGTIVFNKVIDNTSNSYMINTVEASTVNVSDSYKLSSSDTYIGTINGNFANNLLFNKTFLTTLGYDEFVDNIDLESNSAHVWIYEKDLPILYLDGIINPTAKLYVSSYSWNNIGYELENIYFKNNQIFTVQKVGDLGPSITAYYHIESSTIPLTKSQIESISDWQLCTSTSSISTDGKYIIYIKVESNDEVSYINSDVIVMDTTSPTISINDTWTTHTSDVNTISISGPTNYSITATDINSGIKDIYYYVSNTILDNFDNITFTKYETPVLINEFGSYIIYVKAIDNSGNITYANTDYIKYGGYTLNSLKIGRNNSLIDNLLITNKSTIVYNFTYEDVSYVLGNYHVVESNVNLPINTKLTLIDNNTNEKYIKVLTEEQNSILFSDFIELGKSSSTQFVEKTAGLIDEDYSLIVDFSNTNIISNINSLIIKLKYNDTRCDINTLAATLKPVTIYANKDAALSIITSFNDTINYNSNSVNTIPLSISLNYNFIDSKKIYDTTYEDKEIGIYLKMVDSQGNIVSKEYLKNFKFKIGTNYYFVSNDGIVRIKLDNGLNSFNNNLVIETSEDNSDLNVGNYYFKIYANVSYDGKNTSELSSQVVTIPVNNNQHKYNYNFNVVDNNNKIIHKNETSSLNFKALQNGNLSNPNIRISLYKKKTLTYTNQEYEIVDIQEYISNSLEIVTTNVYYAFKTPISYNGFENTYNNITLNLLNNKFGYNSYKFVFELYDNNIFISKTEQTFIAK